MNPLQVLALTFLVSLLMAPTCSDSNAPRSPTVAPLPSKFADLTKKLEKGFDLVTAEENGWTVVSGPSKDGKAKIELKKNQTGWTSLIMNVNVAADAGGEWGMSVAGISQVFVENCAGFMDWIYGALKSTETSEREFCGVVVRTVPTDTFETISLAPAAKGP